VTASRVLVLVCVGVVLALLLTVAVVARAKEGARPEHGITRTVDEQFRTVCSTLGGPSPTAISCVGPFPGNAGTTLLPPSRAGAGE
jgi:hypothetical protein